MGAAHVGEHAQKEGHERTAGATRSAAIPRRKKRTFHTAPAAKPRTRPIVISLVTETRDAWPVLVNMRAAAMADPAMVAFLVRGKGGEGEEENGTLRAEARPLALPSIFIFHSGPQPPPRRRAVRRLPNTSPPPSKS